MERGIIGLTGQTGAGKSLVRDYFAGMGAAVVDADSVAHDLADTDLECLVDVVEHFSCMVLNEHGKLDRRRLGRIVFSDRKQLLILNKIMFPYIKRRIAELAESAERRGARFVVIDAAALFESGCDGMCGAVIAVTADADTRLERIIARDGLSRKDAQNRIAAQHDDEFYTGRADFMIRNTGGTDELSRQARRIFGEIRSESFRREHADPAETAAETQETSTEEMKFEQ